ncbi:MAG: ATP-binding protein, partial [Cyanobacteria bacterium P01_E01_bin.43]
MSKPNSLGIDSTLQALPLYDAHLDIKTSGRRAAELFNQSPELPGLLLIDQQTAVGVLSRYRFSDYLLRPRGCELFLSEPLSVLYSYARIEPLVFAADTPVLTAAPVALRRPTALQGEPLLVKTAAGDRLLNSHDLNKAHWQIRGIETQVRYERTQAAILQSQKMAALGRLVDGVSHEILDPLGFVGGNLIHVDHYCRQLLALIAAYEQLLPAQAQPSTLTALKEEIELEFLQTDLPNTLNSVKSGAERLKQLASSLQNFCHIDEVYPKPADVHSLMNGIVLLLKSRLTTQIEVVRHYTSLPPVPCFSGQLGQVLMNVLTHCIDNLLSSAARQAVDAELKPADATTPITATLAPKITLTTQIDDGIETDVSSQRWVSIKIADNGPSLPRLIHQDIIDSFTVQQRLERETDLAVSYRIITAKHGGQFWVRSRTPHDLTYYADAVVEFQIRCPHQR